MAQTVTEKLPLRLLLNAEPFGFGPTAAIAAFFPSLRKHFATIGYMGKRHTLDLQQGLPYDAIHDFSHIAKDKRSKAYAPIFANYDILFTAMDHKVAEAAQKVGLKTFYYDALAWYWPKIPAGARHSDLYMAQDFFGVPQRLKDVFARHGNAQIVPPIVPALQNKGQTKTHVLINLGGLQNPYWPVDDVIAYARTVITALRTVIPASARIIIAGSEAVSSALTNEGVITFPRQDMMHVLSGSKLAFMTPGLGNIFDAAAFNIPTIWLPPANDSQGQQLDLIGTAHMSDGALHWHDIFESAQLNYKDHQSIVLNHIAATATRLSHDIAAQYRFAALARQKYAALTTQSGSKTSAIIQHFGQGGENAVTQCVIKTARSYCYA